MIRTIAALVVLPLLLGGCAAEMAEHDQRIAHPLSAEQKNAVAMFDRVEGRQLSAFDRDRLARLAGESLKRGAGPVVIIAAAADFAGELAGALRSHGIAEIEIRVAADGDVQAGSAEIRVPLWQAVVPECGTFERGITPDYTNAPHSMWGCSVQRNKGLMVQNPADLIRARESSGRDAGRASDVLGKYGRGEATGSAIEARTGGSTSAVGSSGK